MVVDLLSDRETRPLEHAEVGGGLGLAAVAAGVPLPLLLLLLLLPLLLPLLLAPPLHLQRISVVI